MDKIVKNVNKKEKKMNKLNKKLKTLTSWRKLYVFPVFGACILGILATLISLPFGNTTASLIIGAITSPFFVGSILNYFCYDAFDNAFYARELDIRNKIESLVKETGAELIDNKYHIHLPRVEKDSLTQVYKEDGKIYISKKCNENSNEVVNQEKNAEDIAASSL